MLRVNGKEGMEVWGERGERSENEREVEVVKMRNRKKSRRGLLIVKDILSML